MGIYSYLQENPEENIDLTVDTAQGQVLVTDDNGNNGVLLTQSQLLLILQIRLRIGRTTMISHLAV